MRSKLSLRVLVSLGLGVSACTGASQRPGAPDGSAGSVRDASTQAGGGAAADGGRDASAPDAMDAGGGDSARDAGPREPAPSSADAGGGGGTHAAGADASPRERDAGAVDAGVGAGVADAGHAKHDAGSLTTVSFQEGVAGYHGTKSVGISDYAGLGEPGQWNANGATFADGDNDWCTGINIPYAPAYTEYWLIRFEDLNLPSAAEVVSASLAVNAFANDTDTSVFLSGRYLSVGWAGDTPQTCAGCSSAMVGFRYRDGSSAPWAALGASGEGTDLLANKSFRLPDSGFFPTGHSPSVFESALDPAVVQRWLAGQNFGVRIVAGVSGVHVSVVPPTRDSSERPVSTRPRLTITYALP